MMLGPARRCTAERGLTDNNLERRSLWLLLTLHLIPQKLKPFEENENCVIFGSRTDPKRQLALTEAVSDHYKKCAQSLAYPCSTSPAHSLRS
jgi:hypothetical protein